MAIDAGAVITGVGLVVAGLVWLLRLEGKVSTQAELHKKLAEDVTYIRSRIDTAINGHS